MGSWTEIDGDGMRATRNCHSVFYSAFAYLSAFVFDFFNADCCYKKS